MITLTLTLNTGTSPSRYNWLGVAESSDNSYLCAIPRHELAMCRSLMVRQCRDLLLTLTLMTLTLTITLILALALSLTLTQMLFIPLHLILTRPQSSNGRLGCTLSFSGSCGQ